MLQRQPLDFFVVNGLSCLGNAIGHHLVETTGKVDRAAVGQVTTVGKVHPQDGVTRLTDGVVDRHVGLGTGVGLHIGMVRPKQLLGTVNGQLLHHIHMLTAAIVTLARIPFGVLVGHDTALGFQHCLGYKVLRGDQLQVILLALGLVTDRFGDCGVKLFKD